jgi:hypothetical protein
MNEGMEKKHGPLGARMKFSRCPPLLDGRDAVDGTGALGDAAGSG